MSLLKVCCLGLLLNASMLAAMPFTYPSVGSDILAAQQGRVLLKRLQQQNLRGVSMYALLNAHEGWQRAKNNQIFWRLRMPASPVRLQLQTNDIAEVVTALNHMLIRAPALEWVDYQQSKPMSASQFNQINRLLTSYASFYTCEVVMRPCLTQLEIQYEFDDALLMIYLEHGWPPRYMWQQQRS